MSMRSGHSSVYSDDSLTSYMGQPTQKKTEGPPKDTFDKCPACMQRFDFLKRATTSLGRVPLILPCKHTVCEICIYRASTSEITSCPVCLEQIPLPHDYKDRLCELFTPHYAVIGYLVWTKNCLPRMSSTLRPTGVTLSGRQSHVSGNGQDTSESDVDDSLAELGELEFKKCLEHSDAYANIHCQTCEMQICCYCFVENHSGHQPVHLYKIDDNAKKELEDFKTAAKCILHQLQATQEKVKGLKTFDVSYVEAAVESTFAALHARLHLAERSFKRDLLSASNNSLLPQHGLGGGGHLGNEIRQSIKKIKKMLSSIDLVQSKQINVKYLLEEVKKAKEIPCRLMCDSGEMEPIRFIINENFDEIENCFTVNKNFGQEYRLVPLEDAQFKQNLSPPESVKTIKSRKTSSSASQIKVELKFGPPTPLSKITDNPPVQTSNSSKQTSNKTSQRNRKDHIKRVIVTHLNDLNSFYVQDVADNSKLTLLNKKLLKAVNEGPTGPIVKDRVYAVLYVSKKDMVWRRAKILKILNEDEDGGADSEPQYFVLYIDYGNTQLVSKDKIKSLNLALSNQDPLATECKLINPMGKQSWPDNAKLDFAQIVADKELLLRSSGSSGDMILEVDLLVPDSAGDHISIIKILLEQCRPADNEAGRADSSFSKLKFFENSKTFRLEQVEYVNITHIDDPDNICVQLVSNESAIQQIKSDLKKLYSGSGATAAVSCVPVVGTDVVVNYKSQLHGNWHRSRVRSLDYASKMADVFFVDWGATATVPWSSIKLLTEEVVKLESQAIFVKLADVAPKQTNKWSQHASNYLRDELIHDPTSFKIAVSRVAPLEVALFKITREADVCINALLVENGFAISTGKISETVEWLHEPKKPEKLKDDNLSSQILKKSEQTVLTSTEEEAEDPDDRFRQQVTVSRCHGPDLIYVKFLANKKKEEQMYKELQIYYNNAKNRIAKTEWPVNKECVVWDKKHHQHVRAWVKEKITDTTYLVCLYDQARDLIVPVKSMYVYAAYFKKYLCFTYKCHLGNIKPAGDSGKWSQLAHEILQKMFDTYKTVYLRKIEGDNVDRSMCVIMWYVLTLAGNALEPSKVSYIQINKVLVESGVAFNSTSSAAAIATAPSVVVSPGNAASSSTTQSLVAKESIKVDKRTEGDVNSEGDSDSSATTGKTKKTLKSKKEGKQQQQQQQQTRELNEDGLDSDTARIIGGLMPPVDSDEETNGRRANVNDIADAMVTAGDKMLQNIERVRDWNVLMEAEDAQGGDMMVIQQTTTTIMGHLNVDREGNVYADFNPDIRYDYGEGEARYHEDATTTVVPPGEADESSAPGTGTNEDEPPAITNWLPPLPLKAFKCHTILKCIDDDGIFYVRDVQLDALYMDMEKRLKEFFDGANLPAERIHWSPGDMCTIHWENDYWYRGSVLMYEPGKDDNISVEMIDFGSSHLVTWEQLRKQVMYPDLPPFVNKVQMYGIAPRSGHWIKDDIDVMMDNVTDELLVDVKSGFDTDIPYANIYLSTGQLFNRLVCQLLPHVRRIILDEFDEDMDDTPTGRQNLAIILGEQYEYCPLPYTGDGRIKMRVVNFSKYDTVILDVLDSDEEHAGKLATLDAEFQKESALQPELSGGSVDKDALCMCRMKARGNKWSRAVVDDVTNLGYGYVTVLFVDYGLLDMVPIADLKPVKPEWRALPVANQVASLNIGLLASNQSDLVMAQMKELCGKTVSVEVLSKNPLLVHLYDENQPDTLCYQFLVNCRMISLL